MTMRRSFAEFIAAMLLAGSPAGRASPCRRFPSIPAEPAEVPGQHHYRRSGRRGDELQGQYFRLHPHRPSDHLARHVAAFRARRLAAVRVRKTGKFVREIGQDSYAIPGRAAGARGSAGQHLDRGSDVEHGDQVRPERAGADAAGQKVRIRAGSGQSAARWRRSRRGRRVEPWPRVRARRATCFNGPPTWRGMPPETSMWPTAYGNARVAKFDKNGKFIKSWGSRGTGAGPVQHGARDRASTRRATFTSPTPETREFRSSTATGTSRRRSSDVGTPAAVCITPGPHQYLYSSNSNPPDDIDSGGEIYKLELDGKIVGKFGRAGKLPKEFGTVNAIDCRRENELYVGEIGNWRVQKLTLH